MLLMQAAATAYARPYPFLGGFGAGMTAKVPTRITLTYGNSHL